VDLVSGYSEKLVGPGFEPGTSVSAGKNSDHKTTEVVHSVVID
jgi:hypothetical protein